MQTTRYRAVAAAVAAALIGAASASEAGEGSDSKFRVSQADAAEVVTARAIPERAGAAQYFEDSVITARIKAALLRDPVMSGLTVGVETHQGTVVLSGFVDNESQAQRAAGIAAGVQGVVIVKNALATGS
jgi:osmotically-inducible protein OsmY